MKLVHPILGPLSREKDDIIYIVSDLHLNHQKEFLWGGRSGFINSENNWIEFESAEEYSNYIINELTKLGQFHKDKGEKAYLISLGDNAFTDKDMTWIKKFISLPFEHIYTLAGNHSSGLKDILSDGSLTHEKMTVIPSNITFRYNGKKHLILSHYPIMDWDTISYGCLCGHCHSNNPVLNRNNSSFGCIFDCGVDNAFNLFGRCYFTIEECIEILKGKTNKK